MSRAILLTTINSFTVFIFLCIKQEKKKTEALIEKRGKSKQVNWKEILCTFHLFFFNSDEAKKREKKMN